MCMIVCLSLASSREGHRNILAKKGTIDGRSRQRALQRTKKDHEERQSTEKAFHCLPTPVVQGVSKSPKASGPPFKALSKGHQTFRDKPYQTTTQALFFPTPFSGSSSTIRSGCSYVIGRAHRTKALHPLSPKHAFFSMPSLL